MKESRAKQLSDLSPSGSGWLFLYALMPVGVLLGGLVGWILGAAREGAGIGVLASLPVGIVLVVRAHRQLNRYRGEHRMSEVDPTGPPL